jgi:hypothetical protein
MNIPNDTSSTPLCKEAAVMDAAIPQERAPQGAQRVSSFQRKADCHG